MAASCTEAAGSSALQVKGGPRLDFERASTRKIDRAGDLRGPIAEESVCELSIGDVAQRLGVNTSAIRYYESVGLLPRAVRCGGHRVYDDGILAHLAFIRSAQRSGFRIGEIRTMVTGLTSASRPGERWRAAADRKLAELDQRIAELEAKKRMLQRLVKCQCPSLVHYAHDAGVAGGRRRPVREAGSRSRSAD
jgi:MerR family redox-sensitive transcriptional activator SoxR